MSVHVILSFVIDKGCFPEAFLLKPRGGRRKPRMNPLSSL